MTSSKEQKLLTRLEGENLEEKIEIITTDTSPPLFQIRSLRWGRGIGWYVQKTITLDQSQLKMLTHVLRRSAVMSAKKSARGKVIPFPDR
jgi:hypothetical protein